MNQNLYKQEDPFGKQEKWIKGICLRPVTMRDYFAWLDAKPALTVRLSTLPPQLAVLPYLSAVFALEAGSVMAGKPLGLLRRISAALCLSLGIAPGECEKAVRFHVASDDMTHLTGISVLVPETIRENALCGADRKFRLSREAVAAPGEDAPECRILETGETVPLSGGRDGTAPQFLGEFLALEYTAFPKEPTVTLRPMEFSQVRSAMAELNGLDLPDEAENTELLEARRKKAEISTAKLKGSPEALLDAVALLSGARMEDLKSWTVKEFERRRETVDRVLRFLVCGIGETCGSKWENGNPHPSWCFDRAEGMLSGFTPVSQVLGKLGSSEGWLARQIENQKDQKKG